MQSSASYAHNPPGTSTPVYHPPSSSSLPLSSFNADSYSPSSPHKRRRVDRACDMCRRRKTKCDGPKMPDNICSNCIQSRKACTYLEASKPRGPPKAYVIGLEDRLERMETLLKRLRPDQDFSDELGPPVIRDSWKDPEPRPSSKEESASNSRSRSRTGIASSRLPTSDSSLYSSNPLPVSSHSSHLVISSDKATSRSKSRHRSNRDRNLGDRSDAESVSSNYSYSSDTDDLIDDFENGMRRLTLHAHGPQLDDSHLRFHGQSSSMKLIDATRKFKQQHLMQTNDLASGSGESSSSATNSSPSPAAGTSVRSMRRPEYWRSSEWEIVYEGLHVDSPELLDSVLRRFPPVDLAEHLIDLYFQHVNPCFPLLHRPTFEKHWREGLHNNNIWFACVLASLFGVASRWSDDPRVLPQEAFESGTNQPDWTLAGWNFFMISLNIHRSRRSLLYPATLYEVQTFTLMAMYLRGTVNESVGWTFISVGIRKAQDVGAHRRTVYKRNPSADEELWKRAFWLLVAFDRIGSAALGRACGTYEEDFDLELPLDVDDEYWDTQGSAVAFQQPSDVPSKIRAFILWIKLTQIIAFILRTLYALGPSNLFLGRLPMPDSEAIVKQLDGAMSEWADSVPDHLKWSKQIDDPVFSNQAAMLYSTFYLAQILTYRPFLPCPRLPSEPKSNGRHSLSSSALAICSNAAKSCARIVEAQMQRAISNIPNFLNVVHVSTATLIVNFWELKCKEKAQNANPMEDIKPQYIRHIQSLKEDIDLLMKALEWAAHRFANVALWLQQLRMSMPSAEDDVDNRSLTSDIVKDDAAYLSRGRPLSSAHFNQESSAQLLDMQSTWHWDYSSPQPPSHFLPSSAWDNSSLPIPIQHHPSRRSTPLRMNTHPAPAIDRPHYPYRRDTDPLLVRQEPTEIPPNLPRPTSFWPPSQPSSSFSGSPTRSSSVSRPYNNSERGLPFISSMRRPSFNSSEPSGLPEGYETPPVDQSRQFDTAYKMHSNHDVRDVYQHQHLPTSDTRSIPAVYDRRGFRTAEWENYRVPKVDDPQENSDHASWGHAQDYMESATSRGHRMPY